MPRPKTPNKTPPQNPNIKSEVLSFTLTAEEKIQLFQRKGRAQSVSDFLRAELVNEAKLAYQFGGVSYTIDKLIERVTKMEEEVMTKVEKATTHHNHLMAQVVEIFKRVEGKLNSVAETQTSSRQELLAVVTSVNNLVNTLGTERTVFDNQVNHLTERVNELIEFLATTNSGSGTAPGQNNAPSPGGP